MKKSNLITFYALLLIVAITFSNCRKKENVAPVKPVQTYIVKFVFNYTNPAATNVSNSVNILNGTLQYNFSNVSTGYEFSISAKTDDVISFGASNSASPGYCSVSNAIYLDGALWQLDAKNNPSGPVDAFCHGVIP